MIVPSVSHIEAKLRTLADTLMSLVLKIQTKIDATLAALEKSSAQL